MGPCLAHKTCALRSSVARLGLLLTRAGDGGGGAHFNLIPSPDSNQHLFFIKCPSGLSGKASEFPQATRPSGHPGCSRGGQIFLGPLPTLPLALTHLRATSPSGQYSQGGHSPFQRQPACPSAPGCPLPPATHQARGRLLTPVHAEPGTSCPSAQNRRPPIALSLPGCNSSLPEPLKRKSLWFFLGLQAEGGTSRVFCFWTWQEAGRALGPPIISLTVCLTPMGPGPPRFLFSPPTNGVKALFLVSTKTCFNTGT